MLTVPAPTYLVPERLWRKAAAAVEEGRVRSYRIGLRSIYGTVVGSDGQTLYTPLIGPDGAWSCSCEGAASGHPCYHLVAVAQKVDLRGLVSFLVRPKVRP